jgi:hypothetical protein
MTVHELIQVLERHPPDAPIELSVYGHKYNSERDVQSCGHMGVITRKDGSVVLAVSSYHEPALLG